MAKIKDILVALPFICLVMLVPLMMIWMGIETLQYDNYGWIFIVIGVLFILVLVSICINRSTQPDTTSEAFETPASQESFAYQVPSKCPDCGGSLNQERIEYIGPLQVCCPYCSATVDMKKIQL